MGADLGKIDGKLPYPIYIISKKLSKDELNCTVTEKEHLVFLIHYITGYQFFFHTNHENIK